MVNRKGYELLNFNIIDSTSATNVNFINFALSTCISVCAVR